MGHTSNRPFMKEASRNFPARFGFEVSDHPKIRTTGLTERNAGRFGRFDVFFLHVLQVWGLKSSNLKLKGGHVWAKLVGVENRVQVPTQTRMPLRNSHLQIEFPTGG